MTLRRVLKNIATVVSFTMFVACGADVAKERPGNTKSKHAHPIQAMSQQSNSLLLIKYKHLLDSTIAFNPEAVLWQVTLRDSSKIDLLKKSLSNSINGGYCWPMNHHYSIDFYKDQVLLGKCFVDTSSYPTKAVFFDGGYQTSFDIALKDWNSVIGK